jgi:hypothetical protein
MPRVVSSTEVTNKFATLMQWANDNHDSVVIEVRGKPRPRLSLIQITRNFCALDELRKEIRRQNAELPTQRVITKPHYH